MHRIVLEQVRQGFRVGQIVDRDEVEFFILERMPENQPSDSTKAVNSNVDSQLRPP